MSKIKIQNIGAITEVEIELNKVNVIMGEQSSGKSTVAKLISYCQWVEKRRLLDGEYKESVSRQLFGFHHLHPNYFNKNSYVEYVSDFINIKITYSGQELIENVEIDEGKALEYTKTKNIYIPAERNFVSVIPNLKKYNETNDNILSLIYDWFSAKRNFTKKNSLPILNFDINYYYQESADVDMLILNKAQKEISLETSSSGLQSVIPLLVLLEYLTKNIYDTKSEPPRSVKENEYLETLFRKYYDNTKNINPFVLSLLENRDRVFYHSTKFIIEEPEQNLFPSTQRDLVYYLLEKLNSERKHSLIITTHSPYILYALNNCMMGGLLGDKIKESDKENLNCSKSFINPQNVSIYEIHDGVLKQIQQNDGLISANYFDANMKELMNDFYVMLNYYGV